MSAKLNRLYNGKFLLRDQGKNCSFWQKTKFHHKIGFLRKTFNCILVKAGQWKRLNDDRWSWCALPWVKYSCVCFSYSRVWLSTVKTKSPSFNNTKTFPLIFCLPNSLDSKTRFWKRNEASMLFPFALCQTKAEIITNCSGRTFFVVLWESTKNKQRATFFCSFSNWKCRIKAALELRLPTGTWFKLKRRTFLIWTLKSKPFQWLYEFSGWLTSCTGD